MLVVFYLDMPCGGGGEEGLNAQAILLVWRAQAHSFEHHANVIDDHKRKSSLLID